MSCFLTLLYVPTSFPFSPTHCIGRLPLKFLLPHGQVGCLVKKKKLLNRATVKLKCRPGIGATLADASKRVSATRGPLPCSRLIFTALVGRLLSSVSSSTHLLLPQPWHRTFNASIIHSLLLQILCAMLLDLSPASLRPCRLFILHAAGFTARFSPSRLAPSARGVFSLSSFYHLLRRNTPRSQTCCG